MNDRDEPGHGLRGVADAGAFLARLIRLDAAAVVRLRPAPSAASGRTALWARLPWDVLVTRTVPGGAAGDVTVGARDLLAELDRGGDRLPDRRDQDWRWPLPPAAGRVVESVPVSEVTRVGAAAAGALREASTAGVGGRPVGERAIRDALLDHVAIVVTGPPGRIEVPQRLVQAVVRMGFLGPAERATEHVVQVVSARGWVALSAPYGTAWLRRVRLLPIYAAEPHPNV